MSRVNVIVLRAAGINCEDEMMQAWELVGARPRLVHVRRLIEAPVMLSEVQVLAVPGGFSYGDDVSAGRILANELTLFLRDALSRFVECGGLVLGVCNGFQVLVKTGLLPKGTPGEQSATVWRNERGTFEDRWVRLRVTSDHCKFWNQGEELFLPVAHGEGRVTFEGRSIEARMVGAVYVDEHGPATRYPANPNGSERSIAALTDPTGQIMGLMPHPERFVRRTQHPYWSSVKGDLRPDGLVVFRSAMANLCS
jgi:phosphoribosylformylglycinamidine synthase